ncbi:MAG TPA: glycosyltransferase [Mycobacteriales bacterium]|nr:glycosyltransferase [Mycobacteriales bacterium]
MHPSPLVSVLVVTYNSGDELDECLSGIQRQKVRGGYEVVVVDNASADDSAERVAAWANSVRRRLSVQLIRNSDNRGYAAANDQAAEVARGRVLVLLNPDAAMDDGCLQALVDHLLGHPGTGAASALLRNPDGTAQLFARRELTLPLVFFDLTEPGRRWDRRFRGGAGSMNRRYAAEFAAMTTEPLSVDCPAAACVAVWRELTEPRLFDERLPLFFNDAELFGRIRAKCYTCDVVPAAGCRHGYGTSHGRIDQARKRAEFVAAMRQYSAVRFGLRWNSVLTLVLLLDVVACVLLSIAPSNRRLRSAARGTLGGLWLPGGARPWLMDKPTRRHRVRAFRGRLRRSWREARRSSRRRRNVRHVARRIRSEARLLNAPIELHIDPRATISREIRMELRQGTASRVVIERYAVVNDGVLLRMWGGTLHIESGAQVRHDAVLIAKGELHIERRAIISRGSQLHADGKMVIGFGATVAERATLVDTTHLFDDVPSVIFDKPTIQADITVHPCAFIGTGAVVAAGVTVGRSAVVGALSVVTRDVAPYTLVAGSPARQVREVERVLGPDGHAPSS